MPYYSKGKCIYKKNMAAIQANVEESLNEPKVGTNLTFKSVIPTADKTEVSVFYVVKSDPGTDLVLKFALGQTAEDSNYQYGVIYDKNDPRGRPQKFEDPAKASKLFSIYHLTPNDVEMAGQDAYEKIASKIFTSQTLEEPYEESLEFEVLFAKVLNS